MKKLSLVLLTIATAICFSTQSKAQFLNACLYSDSIQDLPKLIAGQPYFQSVNTACMYDTSISTPLPLTLNIVAMRNVTITGLPPGFIVTNHYTNLPDSSVSCFDISAPASAVDAAIANSPNGDGVYTLQYVGGDLYAKNADPNSPILANYTWTSSIGLINFPFTIMLGYTSDTLFCSNTITHNGINVFQTGFLPAAGSYNIDVESNYLNCNAWTVNASCNWLTATPQYNGNGDGSVLINYTANPTNAARYCTLTIGNKTLDITQYSDSCYLYLYYQDTTSYAGVSAQAGEFEMQVVSSGPQCPWIVDGLCSWVTVSPSSGTGFSYVTVSYTVNTTDSARYCDLSVGGSIYHITQLSDSCTVAMSIDTGYVWPLEGSYYLTVTVTDSCYWSVINRDFCDWVDINPQYGYGSDTIEISYAANTTNLPRSCDINISGQNIHLEQQSPLAVQEQGISVFNLYPNPANDFVTISVPNTSGKEVLSIYTVTGQLLSQTQLTSSKQQVSTTDLANGIYVFALVDAQGNTSRKKVIINR